jgi:GH15 family glucan-1,4-alpha-glucosidase
MTSVRQSGFSLRGGLPHPDEGPEIRRTEGYLPIEDYAALGDGRTLVLVGADGSVDWMCLPDLDRPSVFGALLDAERGGRFVLRPAVDYEPQRRYMDRTNVLETTYRTRDGSVRVTETMTVDKSQNAPWRELVRAVQGLSGEVPMVWHFEPRFDYGQTPGSLTSVQGAVVVRHGSLQLGLQFWGAGEPDADGHRAQSRFTVREGDQALLALQATDGDPLPLPDRSQVERRLQDTAEVWRSWIVRHTYDGPWREAVERSLLAIRLLADGRTGAIAAAGTTSLPEVIGGQRNYDYRFGWVRDLSYTLDALLAVGMGELAQASVTWLLSAVEGTHPRVDPVYALDGTVVRSQETLPLAGYRDTGPVHLGNAAGRQLQLGGFGDLVETMWRYVRDGHLLTPEVGERLADIADHLCHLWQNEDAGLWELDSYAHYTSSKVGCWVVFQRMLDLVQRGQVPRRHADRWRRARDEVRAFINTNLWSESKQAYLFKAGDDGLDCATLLIARREFDDPQGHRMNRTIDAIRRELHAEGPLYYRYSGMQQEENAFLACSFWMVEALAAAGRFDEAAELMDGAVGLGSELGLYSEEMEPDTHAMRGNFPQALTHLALINAAAMFSNARAQAAGAR